MSSNQGNERVKLGERLREARKYLKLSQKEVSRLAGVSYSTIQNIEYGQSRVTVFVLKKLAKLYQRPLSYFIGDEIESPELRKVEYLLLSIAALSDRDREELAQFVQFLHSRAAYPTA